MPGCSVVEKKFSIFGERSFELFEVLVHGSVPGVVLHSISQAGSRCTQLRGDRLR